ncbi:MAG: PHP domain-containing protein [Lentisphaeria bacterium]|nr:PHP domain-containing protein [Lentisphaeria bacterium]
MKIELHLHTSEISLFCGKLTKEEVIDLYVKAGYDAIVITNHFSRGVADEMAARHGITDFTGIYFDTLRQAAEIGRKKGILVLAGCELRFDCNANDYLVYGMDEELFRDREKLFRMTPAEFSSFAKDNGILFYQAHPFRNGMTVIQPEYLFGIEVQNTHPRHDSRNDIALAWAEKYGLHKICGSDCHRVVDVGSSAIVTDHPVKDEKDLVHVLKNDLYTMI